MISKINRVLFIFFLFFLPSQISLHFWPNFSVIGGSKIDYLSPSLYLTEIIMASYLLINIKKLKFTLSNFDLAVLGLVLSNIAFSLVPIFTFFKFSKLTLYLCFSYILNQEKENIKKIFRKYFPLILNVYSAIGIVQFILQRNIGSLTYLLGERPLNYTLPNIAKVSLPYFGLTIRPYSTFSHPNALAGFILVSLLILYLLKVPKTKLIIPTILLLLTFSRTSLLILILVTLISSKWSTKILSILPIGLLRFGNPLSLQERIFLTLNSLNILFFYPLFGIGYGLYSLKSNLHYQPVHNIFLLTITEMGIILSLLISKKIFDLYKNMPKIIIIAVIITGLTDHYWLTSFQNLVLLICLPILI